MWSWPDCPGPKNLGFILGAGGVFLGLRFDHLLIQIVCLGLLVDGVAQLRLPVELDQKVSLPDARAAGDELGDGERAHLLAGNQRSLDSSCFNRCRHALQANGLPCRSRPRGVLRGRAWSLESSVRKKCRNHDRNHQHHGQYGPQCGNDATRQAA